MKRFVLMVCFIFSSVTFVAKADSNRVITKEQLPAKARQFVEVHFGTVKISYVKEERDFWERSYEIFFADGAKIEFGRNGEWKDVDCRYDKVPSTAVPSLVAAYVKEHFPTADIVKMERERGNYEIKLSNRLELVFDKNFKIKDIGD